MVDGVVLLVDASEGPLPQTRFVLRKALAAELPVIVVVNKTDRPDARIQEVVDETQDLLLDLASDLDEEAAKAAELVLELPVLYASGRAGVCSTEQPADGEIPAGENLDSFFDVLLEHVPAPKGDPDAPLQAHVTNLDASRSTVKRSSSAPRSPSSSPPSASTGRPPSPHRPVTSWPSPVCRRS